MGCYTWEYLSSFLSSILNDIETIYLPTSIALIAIYLPIFLLALFNDFIQRISQWILIIPIVVYILLVPTHPSIRMIPLMNLSVAGIAAYNAQKICEWILIRREEFQQWSFWDIHHELFYYRIYSHHVSLRKFGEKRKTFFYTGPIQYHKHFQSLMFLFNRIIQYYLLLDLFVYILGKIFSTNLYEKYFFIRILINQSSGWIVYFFLQIIHESNRFFLCLVFNRPLESIPDLFQEPYRAISPSDFWARWHQGFKQIWIELIFKPICRFLQYYYPHLSRSIHSSIGLMCVFIFSGLMHEYTAYITFNRFTGDQMKFFILQGFAIIIEETFKRKFPQLSIPKSLSFLLTFLFNGITSGYFLKPWIILFQQYPTLKYSFINFLQQNLLNIINVS